MQSLKNKSLDQLKSQQKSLIIEVQAEQMKAKDHLFKAESPQMAEAKFALAEVTKEIANKENAIIQQGLVVAPKVSIAPYIPSTLPQPSPVTKPVFPSGKAVNVMPSVDPSVYSPQIDGDPVTQTLLTRQEKTLEFIQDNLLYIGLGVLVGGYLVFKGK